LLPINYADDAWVTRITCEPQARYSELNVDYRSDVYTPKGAGYDASVVWQFWGRAAEAS